MPRTFRTGLPGLLLPAGATPKARCVGLALVALAAGADQVRYVVQDIEGLTGLSRRTVFRALAELEGMGWLSVQRRAVVAGWNVSRLGVCLIGNGPPVPPRPRHEGARVRGAPLDR